MGIYKKYCLEFFFFFLTFLKVYRMAAIIGVYKSLNITIGSVMKNLEMLKFVCDHLRTKKYIYKPTVTKLP